MQQSWLERTQNKINSCVVAVVEKEVTINKWLLGDMLNSTVSVRDLIEY